MCVPGVFLLSNTYSIEKKEIEAAIWDSTLLSHAGI